MNDHQQPCRLSGPKIEVRHAEDRAGAEVESALRRRRGLFDGQGGRRSRQPRQVNTAFGLARSHQHSALAGPQRIDMSGSDELRAHRVLAHRVDVALGWRAMEHRQQPGSRRNAVRRDGARFE